MIASATARVPGRADALVIGAGPAGAATAIWLAKAGWEVVLVEQHRFPRRKVCGECVAAGNLRLLDELGVGSEFRRLAGPELRRVAWMSAEDTSAADFPACDQGPENFGRALGREQLDEMLLQRARALGVAVLQPAKVRAIGGKPGRFASEISGVSDDRGSGRPGTTRTGTILARIVVDAHGSWEPGPTRPSDRENARPRTRRDSDLFAFKTTYLNATLEPGILPVVAMPGGYGGMVVSDRGRTTLACCVQRKTLRACRAKIPGVPAGEAVEAYLRDSCRGIREALRGAQREDSWLSVGPLRPGIRIEDADGLFRVGNAAGESHPLIGEGISMALQSAAVLASHLTRQPAAAIDEALSTHLQASYAALWRSQFSARLRFAAAYAQVAMHPALEMPARVALRRWPRLLTVAARLAGKTRSPILRHGPAEETL